MTKKTLITLFAVMACSTAADGSTAPAANAAAVQVHGGVGNDATTVGADQTAIEAAPDRGRGRPLGTEGLLYLLLAAFGAVAVALAGYMLVSARRGRGDARGVVLGGLGYILLIAAAFGLLMLNR